MNSSDTTIKLNGILATPYEKICIYGVECIAFGLKIKPNPFDLPANYPEIESIVKVVARDYQIDNFKQFMIDENIGKQLIVNGVFIPETDSCISHFLCNKTIFNDTKVYFISEKQVEEQKKNTPNLAEDDDLFKEG